MRINSEDITNYIVEKRFESIVEVYEWLELIILSGIKICYYDSYTTDSRYPSICFDNIEKFKIWKDERLEHRKKIEDFINKYKKTIHETD